MELIRRAATMRDSDRVRIECAGETVTCTWLEFVEANAEGLGESLALFRCLVAGGARVGVVGGASQLCWVQRDGVAS